MDTARTTSLVDIEQQSISIRQEMTTIAITDQATYDLAVAKRTEAKNWLRDAEAWFDGIQKPAYEAYKNILTQRKTICEPTQSAILKINAALLQWDSEQQRLRREEQLRLEAEARAKAEEERIAQAAEMEAQGADDETVNAVLDAPVQVTEIAVAAPTYERASAVVYRDNYSAEVINLLNLVKYIAKNPQFINLIEANTAALNAQARALKDSMRIPGVRVVNKRVVASGRG